jgi:hypothetical protein
MVTIRWRLLDALFAVVCLFPAWCGAQAPVVEVAGVKFNQSIQLGGGPLVLNGAGIRYKTFFKVYAASLYLQGRAGSLEDVLSMPGAKRIHLVLLRSLDGGEFGKLLANGIERNSTRDEFVHSLPAILRMGESAARYKQLDAGDSMTIDWVPNVGVTLYVKGRQEVGPYKDPEFFAAMAKIWLGRAPADASLKEALLGLRDGRPVNNAQLKLP